MTKSRLVFYVVFGIFHLIMFFFTLYVEAQREDTAFLFAMYKMIWLLKYGAFLGLSLVLADAIWHIKEERDHLKEKDQQQQELTNLKAKLFDLQEAGRGPVRRETEEKKE